MIIIFSVKYYLNRNESYMGDLIDHETDIYFKFEKNKKNQDFEIHKKKLFKVLKSMKTIKNIN